MAHACRIRLDPVAHAGGARGALAYVDDAGRRMYFAKPPTRIVSLAPSITEMLFSMEAGEQLVGVTDFCDYPPEALKKPKVGYSNPNLESLVALQPDLVVAPNDFLKPDVIVKLEQLKIPVFILADQNVEGIFVHIQTLGRIVGRSSKADTIAMQLRQQVANKIFLSHLPMLIYSFVYK